MVWGKNGWLATSNVLDYAGGTVVHITAGVAGLVAAVIIGKRRLTENTNEEKPILPYNLVFSFIGAAIFGALSGVACFYACGIVKKQFGYDDALDAFGIHGVGGIVGAMLTGVFAQKLLTNGIAPSVTAQFKGVIFTIIYTGVITIILLKIIQKLFGLRVGTETEQIGLDIGQHGSKVED